MSDSKIRLDRIYTRGGDKGETSLGDGSRVSKTDPRIVALGAVDELNGLLGLVIASGGNPVADGFDLTLVQNELFDLGADVCIPETSKPSDQRLSVTAEQVERLESWIDAVNDRLDPLTSFVLPGGSLAAAHLHHARAVCRRAEVAVVALTSETGHHLLARSYLNRLSDLLFVLARLANDEGRGDVLWKPGG